jgi:hypothetical protein
MFTFPAHPKSEARIVPTMKISTVIFALVAVVCIITTVYHGIPHEYNEIILPLRSKTLISGFMLVTGLYVVDSFAGDSDICGVVLTIVVFSIAVRLHPILSSYLLRLH